MSETITADGEVVESGALTSLDSGLVAEMTKAEISQQIATARQYPRSVKRAVAAITSLATLDDEAAAECIYALSRGGKPIRGPSIRLAEIVAQQWGNNRVATRVIEVNRDEKVIVAEAVFHDLETNAAVKATVRRRIVDKHGRLFNDDMIVVTGNAASSIARRNAIFAGVPKAVWRKAHDAAENVIKGDVQTLSERRGRAVKAFATWGVKPEQVYAAIGVAGEEEITLEHLPTLFGMFQSIKNSEATVEEMFDPRRASGATAGRAYNPLRDEQVAKPADASEGGGKSSSKLAEPAQDDATGRASEGVEQTGDQVAGDQPATATTGSAPDTGTPVSSETASEPKRDQLMARLHEAAQTGPRKLNFALGKMTVAEQALVTDEDRQALKAAAAAGSPPDRL